MRFSPEFITRFKLGELAEVPWLARNETHPNGAPELLGIESPQGLEAAARPGPKETLCVQPEDVRVRVWGGSSVCARIAPLRRINGT
jgi:hypothetical protein